MSESPQCAREMTPAEIAWSRFKSHMVRLRRKLPYLVWHGDELDVRVTVQAAPLGKISATENIWCAEQSLRDLGISFDTGSGFNGRDWEWDWSLKGPISIAFRGRASKPERRMERPKPKLVYSRRRST
jgi:hypothetical protein